MDNILPHFMIIGAQKCGTTSLHNYLNSSQQIYFPKYPQELHYFDDEHNYSKGIGWYLSHFSEAKQNQLIAQTSPFYLFNPLCPERIYQMSPSIKLIVILRDPIERAYSHYLHQVKKNTETMSFEDAILFENKRIQQDYNSYRRYSYVERGRYFTQLERYRKLFGKDNILVLQTEEMFINTVDTVKKCFKFLKINYDINEKYLTKVYNSSKVPRIMIMNNISNKVSDKMPILSSIINSINLKNEKPHFNNIKIKKYIKNKLYDEVIKVSNKYDINLMYWNNFNE